ncbi:MAG: histidine phosphatase family protein [Acidimicrobiia bacterium]
MPGLARQFLLLRHGQSVWNAESRWQGQADPPLSELGEQQARDAAARLQGVGFTHVVASDLQRASRTAQILAEALGLEISLEPELREIDVGEWTGFIRADIQARWPVELADWLEGRRESPLGGETRDHLAQRARRSLTRLAAEASAGERLLVVSHGALVRTLDRSLGLPPASIPNLAGRWYEADGNGSLVPGKLVSLADPEDRTQSPNP